MFQIIVTVHSDELEVAEQVERVIANLFELVETNVTVRLADPPQDKLI